MAIPFALPRQERFQMSGDNSVNGALLRIARLVDGIGGHEGDGVARRRANPDRRVSATSVVTAPKSPAERRQHAAIVRVFADCRPASRDRNVRRAVADELDGIPSINAARLKPRLLGVSCAVSLACRAAGLPLQPRSMT